MNKKAMVLGSFVLALGLLFAATPSLASAASKTVTKPAIKKVVKKTVMKKKSVSAIKGADEKEITNPTSRCLTPQVKGLHSKAIKQMETDIAKFGLEHDGEVKLYRDNIEMIWSAMSEPYCGFGKGTVNTVVKGFEKSVARSREKFLVAVKK